MDGWTQKGYKVSKLLFGNIKLKLKIILFCRYEICFNNAYFNT